jgi:hypothetical protein
MRNRNISYFIELRNKIQTFKTTVHVCLKLLKSKIKKKTSSSRKQRNEFVLDLVLI